MIATHWSRGEATAFVDAARSVPNDSITACSSWVAHDVLAHAVAGGAEIARLVGLHLRGDNVGATARFEDREPSFRALAYSDLIDLVEAGGIFDLLAALPDEADGGALPFTGWTMSADTLALHVRSELAIHRWDLVGSDPVSCELLAQPELTSHAVRALHHFDVINERATNRTQSMLRLGSSALEVRLRVDDQPDVVVRASSEATEVFVDEQSGDASITTDATARLLMLWGRTPPQTHRATTSLASKDLQTLQRWLYQ
ncbi:hypothetical protein BH10ACT2_BH10ACT2_02500 [soil metagenome]